MLDVLLAVFVSVLTIGMIIIACLGFACGILALTREIQKIWKDIKRNKKY